MGKNELFIDLPEGKLHVYVKTITPDTNDGVNHLDDCYSKIVQVDLIDHAGKRFRVSETEYNFSRTDYEDENGNKVWEEFFYVTGNDIEEVDVKKLGSEDKVLDVRRTSGKEFIEKAKRLFEENKE